MLGVLIYGGAFLFGLLVGRWWAILVPPVLATIVFSEEAPHTDTSGLVIVAGALAAVFVTIGVVLRKLVSESNDRQ